MGTSTIDKEFFQFYVRLSKTQKKSMLQMMKEVKRGETCLHEQVIK